MVLDSGWNEGRILCQVGERASLIYRGGRKGKEWSLKGRTEETLCFPIPYEFRGRSRRFLSVIENIRQNCVEDIKGKKEGRKEGRKKKKTKGSLFHLVRSSQPLGKELFQLWLPISRVLALRSTVETKVFTRSWGENRSRVIMVDRRFSRFALGQNLFGRISLEEFDSLLEFPFSPRFATRRDLHPS